MGDGKALQMGTSHELGQNFAKAFDTQFTSTTRARSEHVLADVVGRRRTRMMGGLIMAHGDDAGLRVPPRLAPIQVVVLLVRDEDGAGEAAAQLAAELRAAGVRVRRSTPASTSAFGRRAVDWELKGVPVRVEVGPRDLAEGNVTVVRRRHRRQGARCRRRGGRAPVPALLDADPGRPAGRGHRAPRRPHGRRHHHGRGGGGGHGRASPGCRGRCSGRRR